MICFCLDMPVTQTVQTHPGADVIYVFFLFWNAVEMIQAQGHDIQPPVHPEIFTDFLSLGQGICPDPNSGKFFFLFYIILIISIINFI